MSTATHGTLDCGYCHAEVDKHADLEETWQQWQCPHCASWNDKVLDPLEMLKQEAREEASRCQAPTDVVIWVSGGNVQRVTSSGNERMVRVFIADRDNAYEFVGDCPEQAIVYLPDSDDLDERDFTLHALGEQLVEQEDTTYIHEAMARIAYACHLEEEYGPATVTHEPNESVAVINVKGQVWKL